tara:strand:- start:383 stop:856 length:474 start_codon:yes stop_codon:yes gene_type:complete
MIIIKDNVFSNEEMSRLDDLRAQWRVPNYQEWYTKGHNWDLSWFCNKLLDEASTKLNFEYNHYEFWPHTNTRPLSWHYDKNEKKSDEGLEDEYPECSIVFYPIVDDNLVGGKLMFQNGLSIPPERNRVVIFSAGILHTVQPFRGKRISYNINPWRIE